MILRRPLKTTFRLSRYIRNNNTRDPVVGVHIDGETVLYHVRFDNYCIIHIHIHIQIFIFLNCIFTFVSCIKHNDNVNNLTMGTKLAFDGIAAMTYLY